jgi:hypothetical protein
MTKTGEYIRIGMISSRNKEARQIHQRKCYKRCVRDSDLSCPYAIVYDTRSDELQADGPQLPPQNVIVLSLISSYMVSERRDAHYNNKKNRTGERKMLTRATGSAHNPRRHSQNRNTTKRLYISTRIKTNSHNTPPALAPLVV